MSPPRDNNYLLIDRWFPTQGVKTVERRECSTILENVCKVTFVTECDNNNDNSNKTPSSEIDSYGAPKAPLLRGKRQVIDNFLLVFADMLGG